MTLVAAEEVLRLYDSYWFELEIFTDKQAISLPKTLQEFQELSNLSSKAPSPDIRSQSLHCLCSETTDFSTPPKLRPILSRNEAKNEEIETPVRNKKRNKLRRNKKGSMSLTAPEFEELKGFMDLGFVFSEEDKDSSLVSIIPGLQRYRRKDGEEEEARDHIQEHKVSNKAWGVLDHQTKVKQVISPLLKWRLPVAHGEIDMKDHLRVWAHSIASAVK